MILLLAVSLSVGRWFMLSLMDYKSDLERLISDAPSYQVRVGELHGRWIFFSPRLEATEVKVTLEGGRRIDVGRIELELDTFRSLWRGEAVFRQVLLDQLDLSLYRSRQQGWGFAGAQSGIDPTLSSPSTASDSTLLSVLQALLVHQELEIRNALVQVQFEQHEPLPPQLINIKLQNQGAQYALVGQLVLGLEQAIELRAVLHGFPGEAGFSSEFYFNAPDLDQSFWGQFFDQQVSLPQRFLVGAELWGHWAPDGRHKLQGSVRLPLLDWQRDSDRLSVTDAALTLAATMDSEQQAEVEISHLQGLFDGVALPLDRFSLRKQDARWSLSSDRLALEPLWQIMFNSSSVAAELKQKLAGLDPVGQLFNPRFEWQPASPQAPFYFDFSADLQQVGVSPWHGAPGLQGVTGLLQLNSDGGRVDFSSTAFDMNFPLLYRQGWTFDHAKGVVSWVLDQNGVRVVSEHLQLQSPNLRGNGRFSLELPAAGQSSAEGRLVLMIGMEHADATLAPLFVPDKIVSESLFNWLQQSIKAGQINRGGLIVDMPLRVPADQLPASTLQMFFDVDQASFQYQPEWPAVSQANPFVVIKGSELLVEIPRGQLLSSSLSHGRVYLPAHSSKLRVDAGLDGPSADIRTALLEGPTRTVLGEALSPWQLDGESHSTLALGIDLQQPEDSLIRIESTLEEGLLSNASLGLDFIQLTGTLHYHERDGLSSERLSGSVLGQPLQASIHTEQRSGSLHTLIRGDGWVGMEPLRQWLQQPLLQRLQGETQFQAQLDICTASPGCSNLRIDSQLRGVVADLPPPFAKTREEQQPLTIDISLDTLPLLRLRYANQLDMALPLTPTFSGAELVLGTGQPAPTSRNDGLWIRGQLDFLPVEPWKDFINQEFIKPTSAVAHESGSAGDSGHAVKRVQLDIDRLDYGDLTIYQLQALLTPGANSWVLALDSPMVRGRVVLPEGDAAILVELDHLKLPRSQSQSQPAAPTTDGLTKVPFDPALDPLGDFDPRRLPLAQVSIASLGYGERDLGRWDFKLQPQQNGLLLNDVVGVLGSLNVEANLDWHFYQQQHSSWLDLRLKAQDVAKVVSEWGATPGLATESAQMSGKVSWQGSPVAFNWQTLNGDATLQVKKGRVLDAGSGTQVMKIFSLFNTNTIWRRLSLDFSDLAKDGISFDTIAGQYRIVDGVATTVVPLDVEGPTFDLSLQGSLDLYHETLSQQMLVTLPITENLALAAVFLATPQIAGAVFLVEKLIGKQLSRFTSVRYNIEGPWANPEMTLLKPPAKEQQSQQMATDH